MIFGLWHENVLKSWFIEFGIKVGENAWTIVFDIKISESNELSSFAWKCVKMHDQESLA